MAWTPRGGTTMKPSRVNLAVDIAYGLLIFVAVVLIFVVGDEVGIAFGVGALLSYIIHVGWKMSRFDPNWMTREVVERVEETVSKEVEDAVSKEIETSVEDTVSKEVETSVGDTVSKEVETSVEDTVSKEVDNVAKQVEETLDRKSVV